MWRRIACHYQVAEVRQPLLFYRMHALAMHRNLSGFEHDMLHAFASMFADPAAATVWPRRRECYANLYATLCGSYLQAGRFDRALCFGIKSLLQRPDRIALQALMMPFRRERRNRGVRPPRSASQ
jgi:hypothetical protein